MLEHQESEDWTDWVQTTTDALDGRSVEKFVAQLTPGASVRFGNAAPVVGRVTIREAFEELFNAVSGLSHAITASWYDGDAIVLEADVTYTRLDGTAIIVPCATVFRMAEGHASHVQFYTDVTPVFAGAEPPALCRYDGERSVTSV